ncbi:hypothetical protein CL614_10345, partial [archaeon]|nr:hypothetical protein [archaeon]
MSYDLTNKTISSTFQNLLQKTGSDNRLYDLEGNEITNLRINGNLIADQYIVSSSVTNVQFQQQSGSTIFGDSQDDTHQLTGSMYVSGSMEVVDGNISGSSTSTGSFGSGYIDNKLGIGTTSPSEMLELAGSDVEIKLQQPDGQMGIRLRGNSNGGIINLSNSGGGTSAYIHGGSDSYLTGGSLGIGTSSPTKALTVEGDISASGAISTESHITASGNISGSA